MSRDYFSRGRDGTRGGTRKGDDTKLAVAEEQACRDRVDHASELALHAIENASSTWDTYNAEGRCKGCDKFNTTRRPKDAFHRSVLSRGNLRRLGELSKKLDSCSGRTINIAVFGGSETSGQECFRLNRKFVGFQGNHFELSDESPLLPIVMKGFFDICPWPNRLKSLLDEKYPGCEHIDIYNFARFVVFKVCREN